MMCQTNSQSNNLVVEMIHPVVKNVMVVLDLLYVSLPFPEKKTLWNSTPKMLTL